MYIYSNTSAGLLYVETERPFCEYHVYDAEGCEASCPMLDQKLIDSLYRTRLDAGKLQLWSVDHPALYTLVLPSNNEDGSDDRSVFGHCSLRADQNRCVLMNDAPIYLRGFIRGITAHDHPNMTGGDLYEAACKNVRQAKKYGFNLVRFHSTIPTEEFVRAADELGLLIHMEIGFAYEMNDQGQKKKLSMSNEAWEETILKYRNHPSVAIFCIGNELHNSGHFPEVKALYDQGKHLAPSKMIVDNSGWGEYDRETADVYSQHVAYFFPMGVHRNMFLEGESWMINGSISDQPLETVTKTEQATAASVRATVPLRPMLSHEAMHYIDIPDYEALNAKFDAFAAKVGPDYLKKYGIEKPRYMTELPALIREKHLEGRMADYQAGSHQWKCMAVKVFMERLRLSPLCGFEMLQFSDCLKYENKNGFVDCFDDDKGYDAKWLRTLNNDLVLLAEIQHNTSGNAFYYSEPVHVDFYASDYLPVPAVRGTFTVRLDGECLYKGEDFALAGGLQKLVSMDLTVPAGSDGCCKADPQNPYSQKACRKTLTVRFESAGLEAENSWDLWFYPKQEEASCQPTNRLLHEDERPAADAPFFTDSLNEEVFDHLAAGDTVVLNYEYGASRNQWQMPSALERFKPCIWDRGSNLGGILYNETFQKTMGLDRYADLCMHDLLEAGSKVNLDDFPFAVEEHFSGIDKPVRDRMKGLQQGIKKFIAEDTLRQFCHLFSVRVGKGLLIVCTFRLKDQTSPAVKAFTRLLMGDPAVFATDKEVAPEVLKDWLTSINQKPFRKEDVMNHFWEIDNKLVEDALFWEEAGIDLRKL